MNFKLSLFLATLSGYTAFGEENVELDIYQQIWAADQNLNGIPAVLPSDENKPSREIGYVETYQPTNEGGGNRPDLRVHPNVYIPGSKMATYDLVRQIFDNYTLDQFKPEAKQTAEEEKEVEDFIHAIMDLEPMLLAKNFIEEKQNITMDEPEWYEMIHTLWFDIYDFSATTPHRSGFEHVVVGEQKGTGLGGYHFWYKYWLDDGGFNEDDKIKALGEPIYYDNPDDNMIYVRNRYGRNEEEGINNPDVVTASYNLDAVDFENDLQTVPLTKPIGGHLVGCSPEGLIALGMATFFDDPPSKTVINNQKYEMRLFKAGPDNSSINTFFSRFEGTVGAEEENNDEL